MKFRVKHIGLVLLPVAALGIAATRFAGSRGAAERTGAAYTLATVETRDIEQTVEATGTVEPIEVVEIKSKASGQIVRMPVETGSVVHTGQLLAQIDTVNVQNQYDEAVAALEAARVSANVARAALARSNQLFERGLIAAEAHEVAQLADANARSTQVKAGSALEIARQALTDATVRAPSDGTILEQNATRGQVIASATASASGGTTLLKMADLSRVQVRALVSETDIGSVRAGVEVSVAVDAFPDRVFGGRVLKIEPQATVQQSVTLFPVLVGIDNAGGLLLPGMNGEVTIGIAKRSKVVAVPVEAVRSSAEVAGAASALGLDATSGVRVAGTDAASGAAEAAPAERGTSVVFVRTDRGLVPRVVKLGISDFDWSEVLSGLEAGDRVALVGVAEEQAARQGEQANIKARMAGIPGMAGGSSSRTTALAGGK